MIMNLANFIIVDRHDGINHNKNLKLIIILIFIFKNISYMDISTEHSLYTRSTFDEVNDRMSIA